MTRRGLVAGLMTASIAVEREAVSQPVAPTFRSARRWAGAPRFPRRATSKSVGKPLVTVVLTLALAAAALAQKPGQTASQFYMAYRAAFDKAKAIEELLPYMSKKSRAEVQSTPARERVHMFQMMKMLGTLTDVKIVNEAASPQGVVLTVEGFDSQKKKTTGKVEIAKEDGVWKLGEENWTTS